jgi:hypothetical protein
VTSMNGTSGKTNLKILVIKFAIFAILVLARMALFVVKIRFFCGTQKNEELCI